MNENELRTMLHECEPVVPVVDRAAIVEQLAERTTFAVKPMAGWRTPVARAAIVSGILAASLLISLWYRPAAPTPAVLNSVQSDQPSSAARALEASIRSSDQLELEVIALLAASKREPHASPLSPLGDDPDSLETQADRFATYRERVRASESLWLLLETSPDDEHSLATSIVELYPNTPAAKRCEKLVMN